MSKRKPKRQPKAETNKGGRPTKLTDDVLHQIVTLIRGHNCYLETAAAFCGISKRTLFDWLRRGREEHNLGKNTIYVRFLHAVEKASAEAELFDLAAIAKADDWKARAWRLERKYPRRWGRQEYVEVDWWESTAYTRLEPGGKVLIIMTRWHEDDLVGRLKKHAEEGTGSKIRCLTLRAIAEDDDPLGREPGEPLWPERWPLEYLEQRKLALDVYWWNALYQQRPGRHGRTEWPDEYFRDIYAERWPDNFEATVVAIDPSKGRDVKRGDYAAIVMLGIVAGNLYCDAVVKRMPVTDIVDAAIEVSDHYKADAVGLEGNAFQDLMAEPIERRVAERNMMPLPLHVIENRVNKQLRIQRVGPYLARKQIRFREDSPGVTLLLNQLKEFPLGDHDDGPDALEMAVRLMRHLVEVGVEE